MGTSNGVGALPVVFAMLLFAAGIELLIPNGGSTTGTNVLGTVLILIGILIFL